MRKRHFWAIQDGYLWRFRNCDDRREWFASRQPTNHIIEYINAVNPEVRRIQRRIAAGEQIEFPVKMED